MRKRIEDRGARDYPRELKELCFDIWYREGQNILQTLRVLKEEGYPYIARKTLGEWKEKYEWEERAARLNEKRQTAADTALSFDEEILRDLLRNKERYDRYFESLEPGTVDNQANYVYMQVVKHIRELKKEVKPKETKTRKGIHKDTAEEIKKEILGL